MHLEHAYRLCAAFPPSRWMLSHKREE